MILDQRVVVGELSPGDKQIYELPVALLPNRTMNEQFTVARSESSGLVTRFIDVIQKEDGNMVRVEIGAAADCPAGVLMGTFQVESSTAGHDQQIHVLVWFGRPNNSHSGLRTLTKRFFLGHPRLWARFAT